MKKMIAVLTLILSITIKPALASADYSYSESSAQLKANQPSDVELIDHRALVLRNFLQQYNSPLTDYADSFVLAADTYNLDWRLVPAITGVESTFGKRIPYNSYNAYGWANGKYYFDSWNHSIDHVSKTLREKYIDRGAVSIDQIARRYAPPSSTWSWKVKYFIDKIDPLPLEFTL